MKRKICFLFALAVIMICCLPLTALAEGTEAEAAQSLLPEPASVTEAEPTPAPQPAAIAEPEPTPAPQPAAVAEPEPTPAPAPTESAAVIAEQLHIDSGRLYDGMDKTYAAGYVPSVKDGRAVIVLPLIGETYKNSVNLTADLGGTTDSPFVFGNYSQSVGGNGLYVFTIEIPLAAGRINGSYPVVLTAEYIDKTGAAVSQPFTVYVTVADGKKPTDPNAAAVPEREKVDKPELFISSCVISPESVGANDEFSVEVTVENIGSLRARTVRLTYAGGEDAASSGILPSETNNSVHLDNIAAEESESTRFKLKTTTNVLAGDQPFSVTLDYSDAYGNVYTSARQFLVPVVRPSRIGFDDIAASVPKSIAAGESFTLPANVYNTGKSTVKNVMITVKGAGLFPSAAAYLGDIAPGETGSGELSVFAGQLSMTEGYTESYGRTDGVYIITYTDSADVEQKAELAFSTEITKPESAAADDTADETARPAFQWWVTILVGFAVIAVVISAVVVTKVMKAYKIR